jgi:hypothetical protein
MKQMPAFELELGGGHSHACQCCGAYSHMLHGFLYASNEATTVYFLWFSDGHGEALPNALLSLGGWGEAATSERRVCIAFRLQLGPSGELTLVHHAPEDSPWFGEAELGEPLAAERFTAAELAHFGALIRFALTHDGRLKVTDRIRAATPLSSPQDAGLNR